MLLEQVCVCVCEGEMNDRNSAQQLRVWSGLTFVVILVAVKGLSHILIFILRWVLHGIVKAQPANVFSQARSEDNF